MSRNVDVVCIVQLSNMHAAIDIARFKGPWLNQRGDLRTAGTYGIGNISVQIYRVMTLTDSSCNIACVCCMFPFSAQLQHRMLYFTPTCRVLYMKVWPPNH